MRELLLRIAAVAVALLGLCGCNIVVSKDPWFTEADAAPRPVMREGLWLSTEQNCRFDDAKPAELWPDCAGAFFVRGKERWSMRWDDTDARGRPHRTFAGWESSYDPISAGLLVANGDHLIVQFQSEEEPDASPSGPVGDGTGEAKARAYLYGVMRPLRFDHEGRVEAFESWPIQCGPLREPKPSAQRNKRARPDEAEENTSSVTDKPFPGLIVVDHVCTAESVEALRRAAVLSEALGKKEKSRWIREGWH